MNDLLTKMLPDFIFTLIIPLLVVAMAMAFARLYRGPHLLDRVIALDMMIVIGIGISGAHAIATGATALLDIALVFALLGFLGTVAFATYVERRWTDGNPTE
ncbi:MAG: cation:proton antiporter [Caldilineaceae bacterium]